MTDSPHTTASVAVAGYLDDLARMLHDVDPVERADLLGSVREYVDDSVAALDHPATEADFATILGRLGRPEQVVADVVDSGLVTPGAGPQRVGTGAGTGRGDTETDGGAPAPTHPSALGGIAVGLGIGALLLCPVPLVGTAVAIGAIVVGVAGLRALTANRSLAGTGLVLGVISLLLSVALTIAGLTLFAVSSSTSVEEGVQVAPASVLRKLPEPSGTLGR